MKALGMTEDSEVNHQMMSRTSLGRVAQPSDIGKVAVFLASDDAPSVTGQKIEASEGFK
ncbi:hypothetical protein C9994_04345 [Marivirga lumbricoides]|uniref:Short-chain dehydrogenase n=1 Tax=Marivirga lumbricoides TaxID=1046115 RepID=A0A2T4DTH3_9BACT|nr:hypothetical protein C9994_04345 [Marivirga lumbricoides]